MDYFTNLEREIIKKVDMLDPSVLDDSAELLPPPQTGCVEMCAVCAQMKNSIDNKTVSGDNAIKLEIFLKRRNEYLLQNKEIINDLEKYRSWITKLDEDVQDILQTREALINYNNRLTTIIHDNNNFSNLSREQLINTVIHLKKIQYGNIEKIRNQSNKMESQTKLLDRYENERIMADAIIRQQQIELNELTEKNKKLESSVSSISEELTYLQNQFIGVTEELINEKRK